MKMQLIKLGTAAIIASFLLSSCSTPNTEAQATTEQEQTTQQALSTTEVRLSPDLPDKDFEGYEFTFLTRTINDPDWVDWDFTDIFAEEETGDVINDATYRRNRAIEEKYNVVIKELRMNATNGQFDKTL